MSITLATTTVTVQREASSVATTDAWDAADEEAAPPEVIASGLPAHLGDIAGASAGGPANEMTVKRKLLADPADIRKDDVVIDESTGEQWNVAWATNRGGLPGLEHVVGEVSRVEGQASGGG